jgi:hypothetical protein
VATWVVDAANVIGARPDGWWRDRPGAAGRLHGHLLRLLSRPDWPVSGDETVRPAAVVLVLEGAARAGVAAGTALPTTAPPATAPPTAPPAPGDPPRQSAGTATAAPGGGNARRAAREVSIAVVHAPGSGDDAIVAAARAAAPPVVVFTSDRELGTRLTALGAEVRGAGALWALLDRP